MTKWYERSTAKFLRLQVKEHLKNLPPSKDKDETATAFWARVEKAGCLIEALDLYDEFAAGDAEWVHTRRETKKDFAERIEREGRQAEVKRVRNELLASGLSQREIQEQLVYRFPPLDGSRTRPWETPDPWKAGRLFRKKEDQDNLLAQANWDDDEDDEASEANWRVECAKWRQEERDALANARDRARELKGSGSGKDNKP